MNPCNQAGEGSYSNNALFESGSFAIVSMNTLEVG